jgi:hypothetical protein
MFGSNPTVSLFHKNLFERNSLLSHHFSHKPKAQKSVKKAEKIKNSTQSKDSIPSRKAKRAPLSPPFTLSTLSHAQLGKGSRNLSPSQ